ncbi:MAG: hypothetical protein ACLSA6_13775 [Holdemania massiliensis]
MNENARLRVNDLAETVIEYPDSPGMRMKSSGGSAMRTVCW